MRYTKPYEADGMSAEVLGLLQLEGACLYLVADHGERFPVLWPAGTSWDSNGQAVLPPEGASMPIGSAVYGGGGYLAITDVERLAGPDAAALAARCVDNTYGEIAIVNNQRDAIALAGT